MKLFKKNNKGFSLVELIVVVAIMAVLMAILIPTLIRHVENTRFQKDLSAVEEIRAQMEVALANESYASISGTYTCDDISTSSGLAVDDLTFAAATGSGSDTGYLDEVCQNLAGSTVKEYAYHFTSKLNVTGTKVVFTIAHEKVSYVITPASGSTYAGTDYADKLKSN